MKAIHSTFAGVRLSPSSMVTFVRLQRVAVINIHHLLKQLKKLHHVFGHTKVKKLGKVIKVIGKETEIRSIDTEVNCSLYGAHSISKTIQYPPTFWFHLQMDGLLLLELVRTPSTPTYFVPLEKFRHDKAKGVSELCTAHWCDFNTRLVPVCYVGIEWENKRHHWSV